MNQHRVFLRGIAMTTAVAMALPTIAPVGVAHAALVPTEEVIAQSSAAADRAAVLDFMARDDVRRQMQALGVDPDEAAARVAALSDGEVQRIAGRLGELPAGQDGVGTVLGVALVVFLVLLITDILGFTKVFPFTRSVN